MDVDVDSLKAGYMYGDELSLPKQNAIYMWG